LQLFDAAFITGTSPKVLPIARIGDHSHFNVNHPVLIKIKNAYDALIAAYR
jgi:branched-chain amino acid aminotransferase